MNQRNEESVFDLLADDVERLLSNYGAPYQHGTGDFLILRDDYGINEVAVILCELLPIALLVPRLQEALSRIAPRWRIRIGSNAGVHWNDDQDLVIAVDQTWSEGRVRT